MSLSVTIVSRLVCRDDVACRVTHSSLALPSPNVHVMQLFLLWRLPTKKM